MPTNRKAVKRCCTVLDYRIAMRGEGNVHRLLTCAIRHLRTRRLYVSGSCIFLLLGLHVSGDLPINLISQLLLLKYAQSSTEDI